MSAPAASAITAWAAIAVRRRSWPSAKAPPRRVSPRTVGSSPGVASRLRTAGGDEVFLKAVSGDPNPDSPRMHRREARIAAALPRDATLPSLRSSFDEDGWVVLLFDAIAGAQPQLPWR